MPNLPSIQINPDYFLQLGTLPLPILMWRLFIDGGWIPMLIVLIQGFWLLFLQSRQQKYGATVEFVMLAVDIPRNNEQTVKAVEQIFAHLSGAYSGFDTFQKLWHGKTNSAFSMELASIDGYVQYYVRTPRKLRDLVESAIYAQYPEAEIAETADYTDKVPSHFPHPEWEAFGTEFVLKKDAAYPIKTYEDFEHKGAEVMTFKDPISGILETMSQLRVGEQLWFQVIITPTDDAWQKKGQEVVDKIMGKVKVHHKSMIEEIVEFPLHVVTEMTSIGGAAHPPEKKPEQPKIMSLSPMEREALERVQQKLSKIGFMTKIRVVYAAKRDVFNKSRMTSLKGAMSQFTSSHLNGFKGYGPVTPQGDYFWQRWSEQEKKTKVVKAYKGRSGKGASKFAMNIEELATLYHFPMLTVKAPLVKKTEAKRAEPPSSLPTEDRYPTQERTPQPPPALSDEDADDADGVPKNLPFA
ncbi:MAG: hypothetical protein RLZZ324_1266 [Candidatus Parcubacteria bacterium]|jgi:hypothetical protein